MRLHTLRTLKALNNAFLWGDQLPESFVQDALVDFEALLPKSMPELPAGFLVVAYWKDNKTGDLVPECTVKTFDAGHTYLHTTSGKELTESDIVTWHYLPSQELIAHADREFMRSQI